MKKAYKKQYNYDVIENVDKVQKGIKTLFFIWSFFMLIIVIVQIFNYLYIENFSEDIIYNLNYIISIFMRRIIQTVYSTFPIFLLLLSIYTFVSSYTIFSNSNIKNILTFILINFIAYNLNKYLIIEANEFSEISKNISPSSYSLYYMVLISIITTSIIYLIQKQITLEGKELSNEDDEANFNEILKKYKIDNNIQQNNPNLLKEKNRRRRMGSLMTGMISSVIALIFLLHTKQYEFINSGVILGLLFAGLIIQSEKLTLGFLYFIDPEEAEYIYRKYKFEKATMQMERRLIENENELEKIKNYKRADIEQQIQRLKVIYADQYSKGIKKEMDDLLKNISNNDKSVEEINQIMRDKMKNIQQKATKFINDDIDLLSDNTENTLKIDEKTKPLDIQEKINNLVGLTQEEITTALSKELIDDGQTNLWAIENMSKVQLSIKEVNEQKVHNINDNICMPKHLKEFFEKNQHILEALATELNKIILLEDYKILNVLKGTNNLHVLNISTSTKDYKCVLLKKNNGLLFTLLGLFDSHT